MWLVLAGIVMFFAAFTSAYLVMRTRNSWEQFGLPEVFWFSTAVIVLSSYTMHLSLKNFREHNMRRYKMLITLTALLGIVFLVAQVIGFANLYHRGITLQWNLSASLLFIIVGAHMVHVLGGVIALLVIFARAYRRRIRSYDAVPVEVAATYWHFVDGLWIYLYIFFLLIR
jgi:cytochrome c oxidase subunit 3